MQGEKLFRAAFPFLEDVLGLPVKDIDQAAKWYGNAFGLVGGRKTRRSCADGHYGARRGSK